MEAKWHRIHFFPEEVAEGKHRQLRNAILHLYNKMGKPAEVALFSTPLLPERDIYLYLSPGACITYAGILKAYRLRPCEKPSAKEVKDCPRQTPAEDNAA